MSETLDRIARREFFLIAGPCVVESAELCLRVADHCLTLATRHNLPFVFKASYTKANRLSHTSFHGPGLHEGLRVLQMIKEKFQISVLTDVHETSEVNDVAEVADIIQIPAFLCRQTALVVAAAKTGRWVNIKKGQFLAPQDMASIAAKAQSERVMLTERGATFGYRDLVVDLRSLAIMRETGYPVIFDVTHSLQQPGAAGGSSGGQPEYIIPMARAAVAFGIDGLFVETHPSPKDALSDAKAMLPMSQYATLLDDVMRVRAATLAQEKTQH